jgi:hypothetical protein
VIAMLNPWPSAIVDINLVCVTGSALGAHFLLLFTHHAAFAPALPCFSQVPPLQLPPAATNMLLDLSAATAVGTSIPAGALILVRICFAN